MSWPPDNLHFIYKAHVQVSQLFQGCNILLVTFRVKNIVSFCVKKLSHFALKSCNILSQKLLHFWLMLHFASKVVIFCVNVTSCVNCYILRRKCLGRSGKYQGRVEFWMHVKLLYVKQRTALKTATSSRSFSILSSNS